MTSSDLGRGASRALARIATAFAGGIVVVALAIPAGADNTWPREIKTDRGILTVYQPQPESFEGTLLEGRAACAFLETGKSAPTFGVFWFSARVDTDRDAGTAMVRDIAVTQVRWPDSQEAEERKVAEFLTGLMRETAIPISLERLKASLATAETERQSVKGMKHDPPRIVVVEEVAELLLYDGEPRGRPIPNSDLEQIPNTPFAVVRDKRDGTCYLSGGKFWYSAPGPKGPWTPIDRPPAEIAKLVPADTSKVPGPDKPPRIVVATEPTELISTAGPPAWKPLGKGELLYIENTETPVIREVASGKVFVLISGRWFASKSLDGPWAVVRPDQLPEAFKDIPPGSVLGAVRVSVGGTPEAADAMLDAQVPQTAAIDRQKATLQVTYDGTPQFKAIQGTGVEYAVNTSTQVLRIDGKYYACDNAVWFVSSSAQGPWTVADEVPTEKIEKIPPSEPVYNVTHVTIYESTPSVVYVGYTPGYMWSYPWYGCPVYGTGWHYPPYWGPVYYPRPVTFGMHVGYNPWTGWSMGFSWSNGFMSVGVAFGGGYGGYYRPGYPPGGFYRPPYYPPGGYRPPYRPPGYRPGGAPRPTPYARGSSGARPSQMPARSNLYQQSGSRNRVASSNLQRDAGKQKASRVAKGPNNVYADKSGNVHRQTSNGWESRQQGQWKPSSQASSRPSQPSTRPSQPSTRPSQPSTRPSQPSASTRQTTRPSQPPADLNRDYQARQQGASRSMQSRPTSASRGMSRGGGGRR